MPLTVGTASSGIFLVERRPISRNQFLMAFGPRTAPRETCEGSMWDAWAWRMFGTMPRLVALIWHKVLSLLDCFRCRSNRFRHCSYKGGSSSFSRYKFGMNRSGLPCVLICVNIASARFANLRLLSPFRRSILTDFGQLLRYGVCRSLDDVEVELDGSINSRTALTI